MTDEPVLIVGAGPTGLNLALRLVRDGVPFRIIDAHPGPTLQSRALAVQARTLELYDHLGLAGALVERGVRIAGVRLREGGAERAHVVLEGLGEGLSPFPFILDFPQDEHERLLVERLAAAGVAVERGAELTAFAEDARGVEARIRSDGVEARARFAYVCGCDGARSAVRRGLGVAFPGGTYERLYYVADVTLDAPDPGRDLHLAVDAHRFALRLPARRGATTRLIGIAPEGAAEPRFADVRPEAERLLGVGVGALNWFSTYRVQHRVAGRFRVGRAFLLGDAGHLHSPVGGQGMNTGIGDAANLAWKLSAVLRGRAGPDLLETYEPERIAFARRLVATTDRLFRLVVAGGPGGAAFRTLAMARVVPALARSAALRRAFFRAVSQIAVRYPQSPLSVGRAGTVAGGDRLPFVPARGNLAPLDGRDWRLQVHGSAPADLVAAARGRALALDVFAWSEDAGRAGLRRDAAYLVRPDGHVGLAAAEGAADALAAYADARRLVFSSG